LALPELLGLLASARKSGALRLEAGPVSGVVHLEDGHCLAVQSNEHQDRVPDGPALLSRLVEICFAVTRQESGAFRFASDEPAPWRADEPVELSDALVEVDRLLKQWREILSVIPSLECRPRVLEALHGEEIVLDREHWSLLVGIDGGRTVRELVQRTARPVIDVCHALLELVEAGAIVVDPAVAAPTAPAPAAAPPAPTPAAAPVAPAPTPDPTPAPVAAPAPARTQPAPAAPTAAPTAPARTAPADRPPVAPSAPAPNGHGAESEDPKPEIESPEPAREPVSVAAGDDAGEAPDKGAFLRLFSGLRDG
jgi:hypothetical protein